jgi:hypothetical protein
MDREDDRPLRGTRRAKLESNLRQLEVDAYCAIISVFRAQGELTWKKESILQDLRQLLRISDDRHKMELKRVREDENLAEIAKLNSGFSFAETDSVEGGTAGDEEGKRQPRQRKKPKTQTWGENKEKNLPSLDAIPLQPSAQPNLSRIPAVTAKTKGKGGPKKSVVKPAPKVDARRRKAPAKKAAAPKGKGRKVEPKEEEPIEEEEPVATPMESEDVVDPDDAERIKEIEATLKARQEQLRAELLALQSAEESFANGDEEEEEGEPEGEGEQEAAEGAVTPAETVSAEVGEEEAA